MEGTCGGRLAFSPGRVGAILALVTLLNLTSFVDLTLPEPWVVLAGVVISLGVAVLYLWIHDAPAASLGALLICMGVGASHANRAGPPFIAASLLILSGILLIVGTFVWRARRSVKTYFREVYKAQATIVFLEHPQGDFPKEVREMLDCLSDWLEISADDVRRIGEGVTQEIKEIEEEIAGTAVTKRSETP